MRAAAAPQDAYPKAYLYRRIVAAKLFIDAHFMEPIDVEAISNEAAFSKHHFLRLFRSIYGRTPHEHLVRLRLQRAVLLMQEGALAVDACHAVGFSSPSSFNRLFKRVLGVTPAAYRRALLARTHAVRRAPLGFVPGCFATARGWKAE